MSHWNAAHRCYGKGSETWPVVVGTVGVEVVVVVG